MKLPKIVPLLLLMFMMMGCSKRQLINKAANDFCDCLSPIAEMNQQLATLNEMNNTDSMAVLIPIAKSLYEEAEECLLSKKSQYGDAAREADFKDAALKIVKEQCPTVYEYVPKY